MTSRLSKIVLLACIALFFSLVTYGNVTDFGSNWAFVQHVLSMDTTFQSPALMWRAITDPKLHNYAYWTIIGWEGLTALVCWWGVFRLLISLSASGDEFDRAKAIALFGLSMGLVLFILGFMVIAGEWFAMWQSKTWNGQEAATRFTMMIGVVLIYLSIPERDLD